MSTSFISPIQLTQAEIIKLSFEVKDDKPIAPGANAKVSIAHEFNDTLEQPESNVIAGACMLSVQYEIEGSLGGEAFTSECSIWGVATLRLLDDGSSVDDDYLSSAWDMLHVNLVSFLYSSARSAIEMITNHSPVGKRILPAINPVVYLESATPGNGQDNQDKTE